MSADARAPIQLSWWYACLTTGADEIARASSDADAVRVGPLTVFQPGAGCEISTFGCAVDSNAVIFDGYLFDRRSVAADLKVPDQASNAEVAAAAYQKWGADIFDRLDGCYLIAVWDANSRQLLIGHDALGRHPVFYAAESGTVWFSANILALATSGRVSKRPNRLSLAFAMLSWWPEAGQTFFEAVHRVRPGHFLVVDRRSAISERKYWDPLPDEEPWLPDRQVLDEFEPALKRAVDRCMDLGAQGIMLSGGVDSVTVAALAADYWNRHRTAPLIAVSAQTGLALSYEERMQSKVTERLAMPHVVSTTRQWTEGRNEISLSLEMTEQLPAPSRIYWVGTYTRFYRRTAAEGLNVLLTGAGGDNWLGVADTHAADLLRRLRLVQLLRFMKANVSTGGASIHSSARRLLWTSGLRPHADTAWALLASAQKTRYHRRKWHERLPAWLCPDTDLRDQLIGHALNRRTPALTASGSAPRSYYLHSLRSLSNPYLYYENEIAHHIETACGLRLLSPYHDRRLVTFFNRISPRMLVHANRYKGLLRPIVAKYLPQLGLEDQRKEYPREEQNRKLGELVQSISAVWPDDGFATLGRLGVVTPSKAERMIDRVRRGFDQPIQMFNLMSAERWVRVHAAT